MRCALEHHRIVRHADDLASASSRSSYPLHKHGVVRSEHCHERKTVSLPTSIFALELAMISLILAPLAIKHYTLVELCALNVGQQQQQQQPPDSFRFFTHCAPGADDGAHNTGRYNHDKDVLLIQTEALALP
eukprot:2916078-Amphidinium_carterae.1